MQKQPQGLKVAIAGVCAYSGKNDIDYTNAYAKIAELAAAGTIIITSGTLKPAIVEHVPTGTQIYDFTGLNDTSNVDTALRGGVKPLIEATEKPWKFAFVVTPEVASLVAKRIKGIVESDSEKFDELARIPFADGNYALVIADHGHYALTTGNLLDTVGGDIDSDTDRIKTGTAGQHGTGAATEHVTAGVTA